MNLIDFLIVLIILLSAVFGYYRGFINGLLYLVRWFGSIAAAFVLYRPVSLLLGAVTDWTEVWTKPFAFLIVLFSFGLLLNYLGNLLIIQFPKDYRQNQLNRAFGVLPGLVSGLVFAIIIAASLYSLPFSGGFQDSLDESRLAEPLAIYTDEIETRLSPIFEEAIAQTLTRRLTTYPGSDETVELPFKVKTFRERPDLEAEMLDLINRERAEEGLSPLEADTEMRSVALKHSADMFERGYFSHNTPENKNPFERMREDKVSFRTAGENLALAPSLKVAHTGLMNSPGHRANILRSQFGRVGIGILDGGRRGLMITQKFRN